MTGLSDSPHFQQGLADAAEDDQPACENPAILDRLARLFFPDRAVHAGRDREAS